MAELPLALKQLVFTPPPEALVYRPTAEEFKDPLAYINRIRPTASKYGICKIIPPDDWQPPFAVNADKLTFSPRIQKLNELEAHTRIKLMFFDKIVKFWFLQGTAMKLPSVDGKLLDLYALHKLVNREGGFMSVCKKNSWRFIAAELGFKDPEATSPVIRAHYEKILHPYDVFEFNRKHNSGNENKQDEDNDGQTTQVYDHVAVKEELYDEEEHSETADSSLEFKKEFLHDYEDEQCGEPSNLRQDNSLSKGRTSRDGQDEKTNRSKKLHTPSRVQPARRSKRLSEKRRRQKQKDYLTTVIEKGGQIDISYVNDVCANAMSSAVYPYLLKKEERMEESEKLGATEPKCPSQSNYPERNPKRPPSLRMQKHKKLETVKPKCRNYPLRPLSLRIQNSKKLEALKPKCPACSVRPPSHRIQKCKKLEAVKPKCPSYLGRMQKSKKLEAVKPKFPCRSNFAIQPSLVPKKRMLREYKEQLGCIVESKGIRESPGLHPSLLVKSSSPAIHPSLVPKKRMLREYKEQLGCIVESKGTKESPGLDPSLLVESSSPAIHPSLVPKKRMLREYKEQLGCIVEATGTGESPGLDPSMIKSNCYAIQPSLMPKKRILCKYEEESFYHDIMMKATEGSQSLQQQAHFDFPMVEVASGGEYQAVDPSVLIKEETPRSDGEYECMEPNCRSSPPLYPSFIRQVSDSHDDMVKVASSGENIKIEKDLLSMREIVEGFGGLNLMESNCSSQGSSPQMHPLFAFKKMRLSQGLLESDSDDDMVEVASSEESSEVESSLSSMRDLVEDFGGLDIIESNCSSQSYSPLIHPSFVLKERGISKVLQELGSDGGSGKSPAVDSSLLIKTESLVKYEEFEFTEPSCPSQSNSRLEVSTGNTETDLEVKKRNRRKRTFVRTRDFLPRKCKRKNDPTHKPPSPKNKELKRLEFLGAGPKMAVCTKKVENKGKTRGKKAKYIDPLAKYVCVLCSRGDREAALLLCDGCDDSYHTFCLIPPLGAVPKGDWRCPKCVAIVIDKPIEPYGFAQSKRVFTLQEFGTMADEFKSHYFHMPVHHVETSLVESEFWKLVSSIDHDVTVLYGADLHTMDLGSGFPTVHHSGLLKCEEEYVDSGWNLNNMPVLQRSVLSHINANISGMKVPWMYVGMCFSTFCWHNEDHWSYSINYLHWGEPKTWYGVPGDRAEDFEAAMKEAAPELFDSQPDLLHQLVTIMNPNVFIMKGIPVFRTDQHAGEFVITFPRAYHAGFNQGYNFAEAVNFAPADWLEMGRQCVAHYAKCRRFCVFSHDELVCRMAKQAEHLDLTMAMATYMDVKVMVAEEKRLRKIVQDYGIKKSEMCRFEVLPDDERQCDVCKTTCFLAAIKCPCSGKKIVCLQHYLDLCNCHPDNLIIKYRYRSSELHEMLQNLRERFQPFATWHLRAQSLLDPASGEKQDMSTLRALLKEASDGHYPSDSILLRLQKALTKAEAIMDIAEKLSGKVSNTFSLEFFQTIVDDMKNLPFEIVNSNIILETLDQTLKLQQESRMLLNEEHPDVKELEKCIYAVAFTPIQIPELWKLKQKVEQVVWLDKVKSTDREGTRPTIEAIKGLISSGSQLPPHPHVEGIMSRLQERLTKMEAWEKKFRNIIEDENKQRLFHLENLLKEANNIKGFLPSHAHLTEIVKRAKMWFTKVNDLKAAPFYPYLQTLEKLAAEGRPMPVKLDAIRDMETLMTRSKLWIDKAENTFLRKHAHYTLLEALCPRTRVGISTYRSRKRRNKDEIASSPCSPSIIPVEDPLSPENLVAAFKNIEASEVELMKSLRKENLSKRANDSGDATYCICQKEYSDEMLQCELCKDFYHTTCVPVIKVPSRTKQSSLQHLSNTPIREKFLCPCCMRTRRPRLDAILPLLVSLSEIPVRIPEGEALQILTERAMNWQDKARYALGTDELSAALAKLSVLSKKLNEAAAREKTEKIISTELKKAASNPELHGRVQALSSLSGISEESRLSQQKADQKKSLSNDKEFAEQSNGSVDLLKDASGTYNNSEHAYSSVSKSVDNSKGKKHSRKSPLVPRQLEPPVLSLSDEGVKTLEELMVEGDLLEITVDEASFIWRILQATRPRMDDKFPVFEEEESLGKTCAKQRRRKRRLEEGKEAEENKKPKTVKSPSKRSPGTTDKKESNAKKSEDGIKSLACEDLSDNDEDCSADPCRRPTGRELLWVQCDGCNQWYHLHCIGMKKEHIKHDQDFMCPACIRRTLEKMKVVEKVDINASAAEALKSLAQTRSMSAADLGRLRADLTSIPDTPVRVESLL